VVLAPVQDTYLEAGVDAHQIWGGNQYIRIKSGGQGIPLLKFDMSGVAFSVDSAVLRMTVTAGTADDADYSYAVEIGGFTTDWEETQASYNQPLSGASWPGGDPMGGLDGTTRTTATFSGTKGTQQVHEFRVSRAAARGLADESYTSLVIHETGSSYNNVHFSSREGASPPSLTVYSAKSVTVVDKNDYVRRLGSVTSTRRQIVVPLSSRGSVPTSITVYSCAGRVVARVLAPAGERTCRVSVAALGTYLVEVCGGSDREAHMTRVVE
jgi:hypothetical protein